jgi:hypothetical protein
VFRGQSRVTLDRDDIDAIADALVEKLTDREPVVVRYVDVYAAARRLSMSPDWVRQHAAELGGARMGDGERGELRFDVRRLDREFEARQLERPVRRRRQRPGPRRSGNVTLLPIGDQAPGMGHRGANAG